MNTYTEFSDSRLVALYDTLNPFATDTQFYLELAAKLSASTIVDLGCGTGLLTCELAKCGYRMIGIEPASAMLEVARHRPHAGQVEWVEGDASKLGRIRADLVIMTGHVAQFFLDDIAWRVALTNIHRSLRDGGHIAFESRNPIAHPWATWTSQASRRAITHPKEGSVEIWNRLIESRNGQVHYEIHYLFKRSGEEAVSTNKLRFRTQAEISQSLKDTDFSVENIFGDWDWRTADAGSHEMIFVAKRR